MELLVSNAKGKRPWAVFHIGSTRSATSPGYEKAYHGCPLSVAQCILQHGFRIGESLGMWYCDFGLLGYGRWHALERSRWRRGWLEEGAPCLWTQAVTVSLVVASEVCGTGGHEPVGKNTQALANIKRIAVLPGTRPFRQGHRLLLKEYPFSARQCGAPS